MTISSPYDDLLARVPVTRRETSVLGSLTRFWDYGPSEAAVTLVIVHGFRGDHHGLEPVVAQLPGIRILAPDLPGFGESEPLSAAGHDVAGYAEWLNQFVAEMILAGNISGRLVVLGHSFGSILVSAAMATDAALATGPDLAHGSASLRLSTAQLILINPIAAPALSGPRGILTRLAVFYYWLGATLPERLGFALLRNRVIVRVMSVAMTKTRDVALRRWINDQHDRYFSAFANRTVVLESFRASVGHDVSEFAASIDTPTLLIAADRDDITPVAAQRRLVQRFPDASLSIIPDVGHLIHYETPAAAAAAITAFLDAYEVRDRHPDGGQGQGQCEGQGQAT